MRLDTLHEDIAEFEASVVSPEKRRIYQQLIDLKGTIPTALWNRIYQQLFGIKPRRKPESRSHPDKKQFYKLHRRDHLEHDISPIN